MTRRSPARPLWNGRGRLRVEQALHLLPEVDALAPLRAALVATSRGGSIAGRYGTLGKRTVRLDELRSYEARALAAASRRMSRLYGAAVEALELDARGDPSQAVRTLLGAGALEEAAGRFREAQLWFESALRTAQGLRDRAPEIEALDRIGALETTRGRWSEAIRAHRRSLALAEAERDFDGAARACLGLGEAYLARTDWAGSDQWYQRGLRIPEADERIRARLCLGLCEAALGRGDLSAADEGLRGAQAGFERAGDPEGIVRSLDAWGRLEAQRKRAGDALGRFRQAIEESRRAGLSVDFEVRIRLNISSLHAREHRAVEAEAEARLAEELAVLHDLTSLVVRAYLLLGELRGREGDETGFVFFEKAIELCRGSEPSPRLEAEVCRAYGAFRSELGDRDEAVIHLTRSREINLALGDGPLLARLEAELASLSSLSPSSQPAREPADFRRP